MSNITIRIEGLGKRYRIGTVVDDGGSPIPYLPSTQWGSVVVRHDWETSAEDTGNGQGATAGVAGTQEH